MPSGPCSPGPVKFQALDRRTRKGRGVKVQRLPARTLEHEERSCSECGHRMFSSSVSTLFEFEERRIEPTHLHNPWPARSASPAQVRDTSTRRDSARSDAQCGWARRNRRRNEVHPQPKYTNRGAFARWMAKAVDDLAGWKQMGSDPSLVIQKKSAEIPRREFHISRVEALPLPAPQLTGARRR